MKYFNVAESRHRGTDIYDLLIANAIEPYGYDEMVHAYWACARGQTKCELGEVFREDPARQYMQNCMLWLDKAFKSPKSLIEQLPHALYGASWVPTQEDPKSFLKRLSELPTNSHGRMWHDVLEWVRMEWELQGEPLKLWVSWGDRCGHAACEPGRGCDQCKRYRCWGCQKVFYWDNGGTDSELCDDCWCEREEAAHPEYT
jgi:hypothetical protein